MQRNLLFSITILLFFTSSNPTVSDDGRFMAFQASKSGTAGDVGCGIYIMRIRE